MENEKVISVLASTGAIVTVPVAVMRPCKIKSVKAIAGTSITEITLVVQAGGHTIFSGAISTGSTVVNLARDATYGKDQLDPASSTATLTYFNLVVPQASAASLIQFTIEFNYECGGMEP